MDFKYRITKNGNVQNGNENIIINSVNDEMYDMGKGFWWDSLKKRIKQFSMEYKKKNTEAKE